MLMSLPILMKNNKFIISSRIKLEIQDVESLFSGEILKNVKLYSDKKKKFYTADLSLKFVPSEDRKAMFASFVFGQDKGVSNKEI